MREVFEALTKEDKDKIDAYVRWYAPAGDEEFNEDKRASLEVLLSPWDKAKKNLFEMFGKELILTKDYSYSEREELLVRKLRDTTSWNHFTHDLDGVCYLVDSNNKIIWHCPDNNNRRRLYYGSPFYFSSEDCIKNTLETPYIFTYNGKKYSFPAGTKYMKFLGKLADIFDADYPTYNLKSQFEKFRLEHSMILNNAKQRGKLCLSIHPLDYMTMSDNESNWESCMSWMNNGCYRQGTVEMMNSSTVVIAYLAGSTPMHFGNYEWDNKKWRQLFVINEHIITPVKPYPYIDEELTKQCLEWLNELSGNLYSKDNYLFGDGENRYLNYYRLAPNANLMYNDFSSCSHLTKIKLPVPEKREGKVIRWSFNYSGESECMCCGSTTNAYDADSLFCCECSESTRYEHCCCCGARIDPDYDEYFCDDDGDYYCCDCRDDNFTWDEVYEEWIRNDDAIEIYIQYDRNKDEIDYRRDRTLWTHYSIRDERNDKGELFVHQNEYGDYYVRVDEATWKILAAAFGTGDWGVQNIRDFINKESYTGYTCVDISRRWWYYDTMGRIDLVPKSA